MGTPPKMERTTTGPTTLIGGRYRLEDRLAAGATAAVWRATDEETGRPVAVKLLLAADVDDSQRARFDREGRILEGLHHPNLVEVLDAGTDDDRPFLVMELVEGSSLRDALDASGLLPPERAALLVAKVAAALQCAHDFGIVHRDVKPANVMLALHGEPKLVDFGIARSNAHTTITRTAMVVGTATYLSPEQAQGLPLDGRSDVYALGCVLYELLTGRPPFEAPTSIALAYKHVNEAPEPPSTYVPDLGPWWDAVVLSALRKDPSRRPSAAELADDLDRVRQGQPPLLGRPPADVRATTVLDVPVADATAVMATPVPVVPAAPRRRRRVRAAILGAAMLAVAVAGALVVASSTDGEPISPPPAGADTTTSVAPASIGDGEQADESGVEDSDEKPGKGNGKKGKGKGKKG